MATRTASLYCKQCQAKRMVQAQTPNHILHLLLSVVTMGFWIPVWLLVAMASGGKFNCTQCGETIRAYPWS